MGALIPPPDCAETPAAGEGAAVAASSGCFGSCSPMISRISPTILRAESKGSATQILKGSKPSIFTSIGLIQSFVSGAMEEKASQSPDASPEFVFSGIRRFPPSRPLRLVKEEPTTWLSPSWAAFR